MKNKKIKVGLVALLIVILSVVSAFAVAQKRQSDKDDKLIKEAATAVLKRSEYIYVNAFGDHNDMIIFWDAIDKVKPFQFDIERLKNDVKNKKKVDDFINETDNLEYKSHDLLYARSLCYLNAEGCDAERVKADKEFIATYMDYMNKYDKGRDVSFQKQVEIDDKLIKDAAVVILECSEFVYTNGFGNDEQIVAFLNNLDQSEKFQLDLNKLQNDVQNKMKVRDFVKDREYLAEKTYYLLLIREKIPEDPDSKYYQSKQTEATEAFKQAYLEFVFKYDRNRDVSFLNKPTKEAVEITELDVFDHFDENAELDESKIVH